MTDARVALIEARHGADDGSFLRSLSKTVLQILMEAGVGCGRVHSEGR